MRRSKRGCNESPLFQEEGLLVQKFPVMGRGVVADRQIESGEFVCEYKGELISGKEGLNREKRLKNEMSYLYFFRHKDQNFCIDATKEDGSLGRLINHGIPGNIHPRLRVVQDTPRIMFYAKRKITKGTQLLYDYGEKREEILKKNPWLMPKQQTKSAKNQKNPGCLLEESKEDYLFRNHQLIRSRDSDLTAKVAASQTHPGMRVDESIEMVSKTNNAAEQPPIKEDMTEENPLLSVGLKCGVPEPTDNKAASQTHPGMRVNESIVMDSKTKNNAAEQPPIKEDMTEENPLSVGLKSGVTETTDKAASQTHPGMRVDESSVMDSSTLSQSRQRNFSSVKRILTWEPPGSAPTAAESFQSVLDELAEVSQEGFSTHIYKGETFAAKEVSDGNDVCESQVVPPAQEETISKGSFGSTWARTLMVSKTNNTAEQPPIKEAITEENPLLLVGLKCGVTETTDKAASQTHPGMRVDESIVMVSQTNNAAEQPPIEEDMTEQNPVLSVGIKSGVTETTDKAASQTHPGMRVDESSVMDSNSLSQSRQKNFSSVKRILTWEPPGSAPTAAESFQSVLDELAEVSQEGFSTHNYKGETFAAKEVSDGNDVCESQVVPPAQEETNTEGSRRRQSSLQNEVVCEDSDIDTEDYSADSSDNYTCADDIGSTWARTVMASNTINAIEQLPIKDAITEENPLLSVGLKSGVTETNDKAASQTHPGMRVDESIVMVSQTNNAAEQPPIEGSAPTADESFQSVLDELEEVSQEGFSTHSYKGETFAAKEVSDGGDVCESQVAPPAQEETISEGSRRRQCSLKNKVIIEDSDSDAEDYSADSSDNYTCADDTGSTLSSEEDSDTGSTELWTKETRVQKKVISKTVLEDKIKEKNSRKENDAMSDSEANIKAKKTTDECGAESRSHSEDGNEESKVTQSRDDSKVQSMSGAPLIEVQTIKDEKTVNKRDWSKKFACIYCGVQVCKLVDHFKLHKNEDAVKKLFSLPVGSTERRLAIGKLSAAGALKHNQKVLKYGGELQVKKRTRRSVSPSMLRPCVYCGNLYSASTLYKHKKKCALKPVVGNFSSRATRIMSSNPREFHKEVFEKEILAFCRKKDEAYNAIKNDKLLFAFGVSLVEYHSNDYNHIRNITRLLGRFLISIKSINGSVKNLEEAFIPRNFDSCIEAAFQVSGYSVQDNKFDAPSVAKRIGEHLEKVAAMIHTEALKSQDEKKQKMIEGFLKLRELEWSKKVSAKASLQLKEAKYNKPDPLPDKDDMVKLGDYFQKTSASALKELEECPTSLHYNNLTEVTLARVVVFNRKRPGDVHKTTVETYQKKTEDNRTHADIWNSLTAEEKRLVNSFKRIETRGKKTMKVSILFTQCMQDAINCLLKHRATCSVPNTNRFLFANVGCETAMRGSDALRECVRKAGCAHPERVTATCLRKEAATLAKVVGLSEIQVGELAEFLGHTLRTHEDYYRLPQSTLQTAKVSQYLLGLSRGSHGKKNNETMEKGKQLSNSKKRTDLSDSESDSSVDGNLEQLSNSKKRTATSDSESETPKKRKTSKKRRWDTPQRKAIEKHFANEIRLGTLVRKKDCEAAQKESPLRTRPWLQIRDYVRNASKKLKTLRE